MEYSRNTIHIGDDPSGIYYPVYIDSKWTITIYEIGNYCGDGIAYTESLDGRFFSLDLSHSSLHGLGNPAQWELIGDVTDFRMHLIGNEKLTNTVRQFISDI